MCSHRYCSRRVLKKVTLVQSALTNVALIYCCLTIVVTDPFRLQSLAFTMAHIPWRVFWEGLVEPLVSLSSAACRTIQVERKAREENSLASDIAAWRLMHEQSPGRTWTQQEEHMLEWLRWCSWGCCSKCRTFYQRTLTEAELRDPTSARSSLTKLCYSCRVHPDRIALTLDACLWPGQLRDLEDSILYALRPVVLHQGAPKKHPHGYKRKVQMSRLSWPQLHVEERLHGLDGSARAKGLAAYQCLRQCSPLYNTWLEAMNKALQERTCKSMFPGAIQEPYLEAALWPTLYYRKDLCESRCWANENWRGPFQGGTSTNGVSNVTSAKEAFVSKLCGTLPDYGCRYDLLQFQFDRHMYRTVCAKAHIAEAKGYDTKLNMQHQHWSPLYWQRHHRILLDLTAQLGFPDLFITVSPYEWLFPFPYWVKKIHTVLNKGPTDCAGPEVLAVAHALHQVACGFLAGKTSKKAWKSHLFSDKTGVNHGCVRGFFGRFEFQEGGPEHLHGRGRGSLHLHCLFWFHCMRSILLDRLLCAHIPSDDAELAVLASRVLKGQKCKAAVKTPPSAWWWSQVHAKWNLSLHVCATFIGSCLRPFLISLLRILRCSQDVQWWESDATLLRYVSGYVSKYAEHWHEEWLTEASSPTAAALNVCRWWHPCEAEMVMTLARESMVMMSCAQKDYRVPSYQQGEDSVLRLYRRRDASEAQWTCLEWLRAYTISGSEASGNVRAHLRKAKTRMAVGVWYHDFPKDEFFWGWMCMNVPHRTFQDLLHADMWLVSPKYKFFTAALRRASQNWGSDLWIKSYLQLHGDREAWIRTKLTEIATRRELVALQIAGVIPRYGDGRVRSVNILSLSADQQGFINACFTDMQLRLEAASSSSDTTHHWRPRFLNGGPGSGKSFTILALLKRAADEGFKCLVVSPTGKLACSIPLSPQIQSMTFHRAFGLYNGCQEDRSWFVSTFDFWVLGEVGMVSKDDLDVMLRMYLSLGRQPVFIVEGDLCQLPPPAPDAYDSDVRHARFWPLLRPWTLHSQYRTSDSALLDFARQVRDSRPPEHVVLNFFSPLIVARELSEAALLEVWRWDPLTFVLCATNQTVDFVNECALTRFGEEWLGEVPMWRVNDCGATIIQVWLKLGTMIMVTRNADFDHGVCNGAIGEVLSLVNGGIVVKLGCEIVCLHLRSEWIGRKLLAGFDVTLGYACTVHKAEGCTLESCTLIFEKFAPVGWGYTAVTRVRSKDKLRVIGEPCASHFRPRSFVHK